MEVVELVERCKKGERKAQTLLYKTYSHKMLGICFRFVSDRQIAQDLMHDGFILIFSSLGSLRHPEKLENWMSRIMTNLALQYLNQSRAVSVIPLSGLSEEDEPMNTEPDLELLPLDVLLSMIEKLPEGYRNIFKLSALDGLSHREIADLLHIEPHSSSSQFFRAKEQLKKMIIEYRAQLILLVLLLLPLGDFLLWKAANGVQLLTTATAICNSDSDSEGENVEILPVSPKRRPICKPADAMVIPLCPGTATPLSEETIIDTTHSVLPVVFPHSSFYPYTERQGRKLFTSSKKSTGWTFTLKYNNGRTIEDVLPQQLNTLVNNDISSSPVASSTDNWDDYHRYLQEYGSMLDDQVKVRSLMNIADRNSGRKIRKKKHHYIPFTFGLLLRKPLDNNWGIETGLNYTRLVSDFTLGDDSYVNERQTLNYIGIPLRGSYFLGKYKRFSFYISGGVTLEIPVSGTLKTDYIVDDQLEYSTNRTLKVPLQWSVDGGVGIQYQLSPSVGIFIEPGMHYYFNDGSYLNTIRKDHPVNFTLPMGIRWTY